MNKIIGLSSEEVSLRNKKYGLNELVKEKKKNFLQVFLLEFSDWLVIILLIAALLSIIVDPNNIFEVFIILFILIINAFIGAIQEIKAAKTLDSLKKLSNHKTKVIRDNKEILIEPKYLTIGDIIFLEKGNMLDADIKIIESNNLKIDEAILTGESIPVYKSKGDNAYSATLIIGGRGIGEVTAIGMNSKIGEIAKELISNNNTKTPLEIKLEEVGKSVGLVAIVICVFVFILQLLLKIEMLEAFKSAISLAVAAIPEGLATVVTVTLAIGVGKMSKENSLVKKLECVETLGCTNIICTDKTGTLTYNNLKVLEIYHDRLYKVDNFNELDINLLNKLFIISNYNDNTIDPIDKAINEICKNIKSLNYKIINIDEFDSDKKYMKLTYDLNNCQYSLFKGAFDRLIKIVRKPVKNEILSTFERFLDLGYRVIAISDENEIIALIAMMDTVRKDVIKTIDLAKGANVKTVMITGDHHKTAFDIAMKVNIASNINEVMKKEDLDKLTDQQLEEVINNYSVFSRVSPFDKVRIVKAYQNKNMVVAMIGDGVNDAAALKTANIGCVMGDGAEISKDSADIILIDNNYNTLIHAVKNGRTIYENIKKCVVYLLSSNIGEVLSILLVTLMSLVTKVNLGIPLLSIHLLWINLITDSLPAFGLGIMEGDKDIMKESPRNTKNHFFSKDMIKEIIFMGSVIGLLTIISYFIGKNINGEYAVTMAFFTISTSQLIHSYNCSSNKTIFNKSILKNKFLNLSFVVGILLELFVIYQDNVNTLFKLKPLPINLLLISLFLSFITLLIAEIKKKISKKQK